jgi:hypothetical protein
MHEILGGDGTYIVTVNGEHCNFKRRDPAQKRTLHEIVFKYTALGFLAITIPLLAPVLLPFMGLGWLLTKAIKFFGGEI